MNIPTEYFEPKTIPLADAVAFINQSYIDGVDILGNSDAPKVFKVLQFCMMLYCRNGGNSYIVRVIVCYGRITVDIELITDELNSFRKESSDVG